ncbi:toxin VasX, partial [Gilliamella sp. Pas-s27]|uniref:toxin VasX n=1 Tax=Gilliamella sp. Pas-s27 TaxID=2687311 RepID=UPI0013A05B8F
MDTSNKDRKNNNSEFKDDSIETNQEPPKITPELINEAAENMKLSNGKCGACERLGFPLFLVRKSIVPKNFKGIKWDQGMLALGDREPTETLKHFKYAYRTLREGYVYILLQKNKSVKDWEGTDLNLLKVKAFVVTHSGAFRLRELRDIKGSRPKELPSSCVTEGHQFKAKFITLDNKIYDKAWIAYSPCRWDKDVIEFYRKNEEKRDERFTVVDLTKTNPTEMAVSKGQRSFSFNDFIRKAGDNQAKTSHQSKASETNGTEQNGDDTKVTSIKRYLVEIECSNKEVLDYFDEEQQKDYRAKLTKESTSLNTPIDKAIGKGVFYTKDVDLNKIISSSTSDVLHYFKHLFCTASHFNSLKKEAGGLNESFKKTIKGYQGEARANSNYQTDEIGVILIEDNLGLAEELSVQRRQLLAPVINGLAGRSQEQAIAIQKRLRKNLGKTTKDIILEELTQLGGDIDPDIIKSFYEENILDLRYNQQYKAVYENLKVLDFALPTQQWLINKYLNKIPAIMANLVGKRTKAIEDYFTKQQNHASGHPFLYFKPETSYARNQYNSIENYKDILKLNNQIEDASDCILFAFYQPNGSYNKDLKRYAEQEAKLVLKTELYKGDNGQDLLDKIFVLDVVGDTEFAIENKFTIPIPAYKAFLNKVACFFYFRFISEISISGAQVDDAPPLGDYEVINISDKQKKDILAIYQTEKKLRTIEGYDVVVVKYPNAKDKVSEWKRDKNWDDKESERLNNESIVKYKALDKTLYQNLLTYVEQVSEDYFTYLLWLFGEQNTVPFWLTECDPDTSDQHILVLSSLLIILDNDSVGNFYLDKQDKLWSMLINNENSIYHYLIEGYEGAYSLFNVASGNIPEADKQLTQDVKKILANRSKGITKGNTKVNNPLSGAKKNIKRIKQILNLKLNGNVTVGAYIKEELIKLSMSNIAKILSNNNTYNLNVAVVDTHLIKAMNMFTTATHKQYKVKVPVSNLQKFLDNLGSSSQVVYAQSNNGNLITTDGARIRGNYSSTQERFKLKKRDIAKAKKTYVELDMLLTFSNEGERAMFEKSMNTSRGNANVDKFKDAHLVDYEQLNTAKYNAEKKWRTAVYDTSVSSAMNVFTLAYQYLQINGLKTNLNTLTDSAFIDKVSRALLRTYLDIALTASYAILDGIKLKALFGERDKTLTDLLGKIGKAGKVLGYAAKSIAIIDSFGDLCRSMNAVTRGDPGAVGFMISSTIGFAAAGLSIALGIAAPWVIVLFLAPFVINFLFGTYDDGSNWDEMDKWINRSIFGKFARNDLYPPYPISDTGNYLSEQDFYLASRKGFCRTAHYEVQIRELIDEGKKNKDKAPPYKVNGINGIVWGSDDQSEVIDIINTPQNALPYKLHLVMQLPDFVEDKATFEGEITIRHRGEQFDTILQVSHGSEELTVQPIQCNTKCFKLVNENMVRDKKQERYDYLKADPDKPNQALETWYKMQQTIDIAVKTDPYEEDEKDNTTTQANTDATSSEPKAPNIGLFGINQLLGRVNGEFEVICAIQYWPEGKTDSDGNAVF